MRTDELSMRHALPHIDNAIRSLEMLRHFVENKDQLSLAKRVPNYYNTLVESVLAIQERLLTNNEYTDRLGHTLRMVSERREFNYGTTTDTYGNIYYNVDAMLPLVKMKRNVLLNGRLPTYV